MRHATAVLRPHAGVLARLCCGLTTILAACGSTDGTEPESPEPEHTMQFAVTVPGELMPGDTMTVTVQAQDGNGRALNTGGSSLALSLVGGSTAGTFGPVTNLGNGKYASVFTGTSVGTPAKVGLSLDGGPVVTPGPTIAVVGFTQVSIALFHACGVVNTGTAYCWGDGTYGQLGAGTYGQLDVGQDGFVSALKPVKVAGDRTWQYVGAGAAMTCGLDVTGHVYCWGSSTYFATGISHPKVITAPELIDGDYTFTSIAVGWDAGACGITTTNLPICWGNNTYGQVGSGTASSEALPTVVAGAPVFASMARDIHVTCGVTPQGDTYCWGGNTTGQLGVADSTLSATCGGTPCSRTPMAVPDGDGMVPASLTVGSVYACALKPDGAAYCWGDGRRDDGQATPPVAVPTLLRFKQIVVAGRTVCGIATDTFTYCWGANDYWEAGTGTGGRVAAPTRIAGDIKLIALDAGVANVCGVTADGHVYCWGWNDFGQLGDGTRTNRAVPTLVKSMR